LRALARNALVILSAAAGRGAGLNTQAAVQDILAGFFIMTERHYECGDPIRLAVPSLPDPAIGTVRGVTLRVTTARIPGGVLLTIFGLCITEQRAARGIGRHAPREPVTSSSSPRRVKLQSRLWSLRGHLH
jgi:small conductance mechanosensitive channel